jgi:uncharacterized membrane protein
MKGYLSRTAVEDYISSMAYMGTALWWGRPALIWVTLVAIFDRDFSMGKKVTWPAKVLALPLGFITLCCAATALYVTFTNVGSEIIDGCQGRYQFPVMIPMYLLLTQIRFLPLQYPAWGKRILEVMTVLGSGGIVMYMFMQYL